MVCGGNDVTSSTPPLLRWRWRSRWDHRPATPGLEEMELHAITLYAVSHYITRYGRWHSLPIDTCGCGFRLYIPRPAGNSLTQDLRHHIWLDIYLVQSDSFDLFPANHAAAAAAAAVASWSVFSCLYAAYSYSMYYWSWRHVSQRLMGYLPILKKRNLKDKPLPKW